MEFLVSLLNLWKPLMIISLVSFVLIYIFIMISLYASKRENKILATVCWISVITSTDVFKFSFGASIMLAILRLILYFTH